MVPATQHTLHPRRRMRNGASALIAPFSDEGSSMKLKHGLLLTPVTKVIQVFQIRLNQPIESAETSVTEQQWTLGILRRLCTAIDPRHMPRGGHHG